VEIMCYEVGEEGKLIAHKKVINIEGTTVHEVPIYEGCVSLKVHKAKTMNMFISIVWKWMTPRCMKFE
jgi:hypothetical protein